MLWELISYLPKDLKSKLTRSASPPSPSPFLKALFYTCIEPRATALVPARLLKGILQACGRGLETPGGGGGQTCLCIDTLAPDSLSICREMPGPSGISKTFLTVSLLSHLPPSRSTPPSQNKQKASLEELGGRYGMITLEFGIKNTEKKKTTTCIWFSTLAKNIALHCKF